MPVSHNSSYAKLQTMNINFLSVVSSIVLLGVSTALGFMDKSVEMGLAITAGAIGLAFANLDKIRSFKGAGFKAEMWKQIEAVIEKETETDEDAESIKSLRTNSVSDINTDENNILEALSNQKYTWRTLSGISKESKANENETKRIIKGLTANGYVTESKGTKGKIWSLTSSGRRQLVVNALLMQSINTAGTNHT